MKKLFILFVLGLAVPAMAEIVSTVSFNPSRIGAYQYLKISRDANLKGGLETGNLSIDSGGTVEMRWDTSSTNPAGQYYYAPNVTGSAASVDMPDTTFLTDTSLSLSEGSYSASNANAPAGVGPNITMEGGSLSFVGTTHNDSYVRELKGNGTDGRAPLQFWANGLNENTLEIKGASGAATGLANENGTLRNDNQTLGFHLAGVDIPHPTGHMCEGSSANCGQTKTYSNLCWVQRCTTEGQVAWVLSLVNGTCPAKKDISCGTGGGSGGGLGGIELPGTNCKDPECYTNPNLACYKICVHQGTVDQIKDF